MILIVEYVLLAGSCLGCVFILGSGIAVSRFFRRPPAMWSDQPAVTVLKPLCGDDPELYQNLRSFCEQDYSAWQIVFGVRSADDPAIDVVRRIMVRYPDADIELVVGGDGAAGNRKVGNLLKMLPAARHDILVIADSDIRVRRNYLAEVTAPLGDPTVGLVTCLYRALPAPGFWSRLTCLFLNHSFLPQALTAEALRIGGGCFGPTMALRRQTLNAIGGFNRIAGHLADDHELGAAARELGLKVVLSSYLLDKTIGEPSLRALLQHELRWARTIRAIAPAGFAGSIVTHATALAMLAVPLDAAYDATRMEAPVVLALALLCRAAVAWRIDRRLHLPRSPFWLLLARDLLTLGVFLAGFFTRRVVWRGQLFRVGRNGQLIFLREKLT
jgi:ceramide glucosyltransferase